MNLPEWWRKVGGFLRVDRWRMAVARATPSANSWNADPLWRRALGPFAFWTDLGFDNKFLQLWLRFQTARHGCHLRCGPYAWDLTKGSKVIRISRRQFPRVVDLAADFDDLFEALVPIKAGHQSILDFSRLQVHTFRSADVKFELAQWPEPDAAIDAYFEMYRPTSKDLVFDIGAECGVSTYVLSQFAGKVVAFEQELQLHSLLERNVARHSLAKVTVARENVPSLAELIRLYGAPAFCKVNLDHVAPRFLIQDAESWTSVPMYLAARTNSRRVRARFVSFLKNSGFDIAMDKELGMVWAHPSPNWYE
jgi:hypothetical protein